MQWISIRSVGFAYVYSMSLFGLLFGVYKWQCIQKIITSSSSFTLLGTLGTFIGLAAGLWVFDTEKMDESIVTLIEGMKISFLTSIAGMIAGIFYDFFLSKKEDNAQESSIEPYLAKIADNSEQLNEHYKSDKKNKDIIDELSAVKTQLQEFQEAMVKASTENIIEALKGIVKDFNEKINEQFGENFQKLNSSIENLITWQGDYKEHLNKNKEYMEKQEDLVSEISNNMRNTSESMKEVVDLSTKYNNNLDGISKNLDTQKSQIDTFGQSLSLFNEINTKTTATIDSIKNLGDSIAGVHQRAINSSEQLSTRLSENSEELTKQLKNSSQELTEKMKEVFNVSDENIKKQVQEIISLMGGELTSVSRKLATDYEEFVKQSQRLLEIIDAMNKKLKPDSYS